MTLLSKTVPSMVQGVSQQAPQQRRDSQAESQFDCTNSPVEGVLSRPGFDLVAFLAGLNLTGAYFYEITRGTDEHYLVTIKSGTIRIYDLADGTLCTTTIVNGAAYLTGMADGTVAATTVDDFTFLVNKTVTPAMAATKSAARPKEALVFFRAGNYLMTYQLSIVYGGSIYTWTYKTPDNSAAANAQYIFTNQLAATFYRALTGSAAPVNNTGAQAPSSTRFGVAAVSGGDAGGSGTGTTSAVTGAVTATSLGFSVAINGNVLRIWRNDGNDFNIDSSDGAGDSNIRCIKDSVQSFSDLPRSAFQGFTVKVKGASRTKDDDYYVEFVNTVAGDGYWQECVKPDEFTTLDNTTMPHLLVNTGYRTFDFKRGTWSTRIAGDSTSAKNPSFIGKKIQDIAFDRERLALVYEGGCVWSKARNEFTFFPDTVQTLLKSAPIDSRFSTPRRIALFRFMVLASESTYLWAQGSQIRIAGNTEGFSQETIESKPSTAYEFVETSYPCPVGGSLYFATEPGSFATLRDVQLVDGKFRGDNDVTQHVPKYIPAGVRELTASDTLGHLFVRSEGRNTSLWLYDFLLQGADRLQSAWNEWRLPAQIMWVGTWRSRLYVLLHRTGGAAILVMDLTPRLTDPGGAYRTRLDMRVTESQTSESFNAGTGNTTITLPYAVPDVVSDLTKFMVVCRTTDGSHTRGEVAQMVSASGSSIVVRGDWSATQFYAGYRITSERTESEFYLRSDGGTQAVERLSVRNINVSHAESGYYRAEVTHKNGDVKVAEFEGRIMGDPNNVFGPPILANGVLPVTVDAPNTEYSLRLVNDSFLPSAWQTAEYQYEAVVRAVTPRAPRQ